MEKNQKTIMIVAGEDSGDLHASHLVSAIKKQNPEIKFAGLGGPKMAGAGVDLYEDLTKISVVGFWEVLKHYGHFKRAFNHFLNKAKTIKPDAVILVDYPGFNLRLAKQLKKQGIKVFYYISPQVWAWKKSRVKLIKKYIDKMLVIFSFEKNFYAQYGINVDYVGHPLVDSAIAKTPKNEFLKNLSMDNNKTTIGLLPGSRKKEIESLLPVMLKSAEILHDEFKQLQFLLIKAPSIDDAMLTTHIKNYQLPLKIISHNYDGINACDHCIVASGTATLETAIFEKPMIIIYKTSLFTWALAKLLIKIPFIGLVNVIAGKKVVPELVQFKATEKNIAQELKEIFTDEIKIAEIKSDLKKVREALDQGGTNQRAAEIILKNI